MEKYLLIALVIIGIVALAGCAVKSNAVGENKFYSITSEIHSLDVEINAADFKIITGEKFSVESNLKKLTVTESDGVLKIVDKTKHTTGYNNATLKLCVPEDFVFENANITTGASVLNAEKISAKVFELKTGAGQVEFGNLEILDKASIKGGAGEITVSDGTLNNLNLNLGFGKADITAKLTGDNNLKCGVGESEITLLGDKSDYSFNVENGVGGITIDGSAAAFYANSSQGENTVNIKGGVGSTNINFQQCKAH